MRLITVLGITLKHNIGYNMTAIPASPLSSQHCNETDRVCVWLDVYLMGGRERRNNGKWSQHNLWRTKMLLLKQSRKFRIRERSWTQSLDESQGVFYKTGINWNRHELCSAAVRLHYTKQKEHDTIFQSHRGTERIAVTIANLFSKKVSPTPTQGPALHLLHTERARNSWGDCGRVCAWMRMRACVQLYTCNMVHIGAILSKCRPVPPRACRWRFSHSGDMEKMRRTLKERLRGSWWLRRLVTSQIRCHAAVA